MLEENRYLLTFIRTWLNFSVFRRSIALKSQVLTGIIVNSWACFQNSSLSCWWLQKHQRRGRACANFMTSTWLLSRYKGQLLQNKTENELRGYLSLPWTIKSCCPAQKKRQKTNTYRWFQGPRFIYNPWFSLQGNEDMQNLLFTLQNRREYVLL